MEAYLVAYGCLGHLVTCTYAPQESSHLAQPQQAASSHTYVCMCSLMCSFPAAVSRVSEFDSSELRCQGCAVGCPRVRPHPVHLRCAPPLQVQHTCPSITLRIGQVCPWPPDLRQVDTVCERWICCCGRSIAAVKSCSLVHSTQETAHTI